MKKKRLVKTEIIENPEIKVAHKKNIFFGIPTTGKIRFEWAASRYGLLIPCNWQMGEFAQMYNECSPLGYAVDEARNIIVKRFLDQGYEWLFFLDHDTIPPLDLLMKLKEYMMNPPTPVISGLYHAKSSYPEPLIYRGRGNGHFSDWKPGDKVWVDGVPMGCTLIHRSLMEVMYKESEPYNIGDIDVRRVFLTPREFYVDPEKTQANVKTGTEDLWWCDRVINDGFLAKAGWKKVAKKKYPFLLDTSIACDHIDFATGRRF